MIHKGTRFFGKISTLVWIVFVSLPFMYCTKTPLEPKAPSWTTQMTIPLIDRTYYFGDLIAKDSAKYSESNGEILYSPASLNNDPTAISIPSLKPVASQFTQQIGIIPLTSVNLTGINLSFKDLTGQDPPPVPWPGPEQNVAQDLPLFGDTASYDYLVYEDGIMTLTIGNTFNFDVNFPGGIQLVDTTVTPHVTLGTFNIGTVTSGATASDQINLSGKQMGAVLKMKFTFQTVNMTGKNINNGAVTASMNIASSTGGNPSLSEAKLRLTSDFSVPLSEIKDSTQTLSDSVFIKKAEFADGMFDIVINNQIAMDIRVAFNLRELVNKATNQSFKLRDPVSNQFADSITLLARQNYTMPVDLRDYIMEARKKDGSSDTVTNGMHFSLQIKTLVVNPIKVVIKKTDSVLVEIRPKTNSTGLSNDYVIESVTGKIPPNAIEINETVGGGIGSSTDKFSADSITFDGAKITLKIFTQSLFPTDLRFTVQGVSNSGSITQTLNTPVGTGRNASPSDPKAFRIFPGDTAVIVFDKNNPDANGRTLDDFLKTFVKNGKVVFPDEFKISGLATIEPLDAYQNDSVGFVRNNDSVYTSMDFSFPLKIGIAGGSYKDTTNIASNLDTGQVNYLEGGKVYFNLESTFPIEIDLSTNLIKASTANPTLPDQVSPPVLKFPQDPTDPINYPPIKVPGYDPTTATGPSSKSFTFISLSSDEAKKLAQAAFSAIEIKLATAKDGGGTPLAFKRDNMIHLKTFANVTFNVDIDRVGGK